MAKKKQSSTIIASSAISTFVFSLALLLLAVYFQERLSEFRSLGLFGLFFINFFSSATLFLPAPGIASVIVGGGVYPPVLVAIVSALGASGGDMLGYLLGLSGKKVLLRRSVSLAHKTLHSVFRRFGYIVIFCFAFVPNPLFDVISIFAGIASYSPQRFFVVMFLGRLLRNILLAYAGKSFIHW